MGMLTPTAMAMKRVLFACSGMVVGSSVSDGVDVTETVVALAPGVAEDLNCGGDRDGDAVGDDEVTVLVERLPRSRWSSSWSSRTSGHLPTNVRPPSWQ